MPQEDDGPDREELLTERNALVERVKELSATWDAWAKRCNVLPYPLPKK